MLLSRKLIKDLRDQLQTLMLEQAPKHSSQLADFEIQVGNASYSDTEVTFKINLRMKGAKSQAEKDLEDYQQVKLKELRKKSFEKRSSEDFCRWLLGEKVVSETLDIVRSITHSDGGDI